jgi:hypothetical protein
LFAANALRQLTAALEPALLATLMPGVIGAMYSGAVGYQINPGGLSPSAAEAAVQNAFLTAAAGSFPLNLGVDLSTGSTAMAHAVVAQIFSTSNTISPLTPPGWGAAFAAITELGATGGAIRPAVITTRNSNVVGGPADMRVTPPTIGAASRLEPKPATMPIAMAPIDAIHQVPSCPEGT